MKIKFAYLFNDVQSRKKIIIINIEKSDFLYNINTYFAFAKIIFINYCYKIYKKNN